MNSLPLYKRLLSPLIYLFWLYCEAWSWIFRPKKLTPHENTKRCYETLFDPLCAETGVWPDYTEGHYPEGNEDYHEAKIKQFDFILDAADCGPGKKVIDLGCGNGKLLLRAKERGSEAFGITISENQQVECQNNGLDVRLCGFDQLKNEFGPQKFDVVILNGPTEHFVKETDVLKGHEKEIRNSLFEHIQYILKPGGKVFITCIHFKRPTDIKQVLKAPLSHKIGSYYFMCSVLVALYSGWYPFEGDYKNAAAANGMKLKFERDATRDYFITSVKWSEMINRFLREKVFFGIRFLFKLFVNDPRYFYVIFLYWFYGAWGWQFGDGVSGPMKHKWLMFELNEE